LRRILRIAFGKALSCLQGQWPKLMRYVENGTWPVSNNACENAIRRSKDWSLRRTVPMQRDRTAAVILAVTVPPYGANVSPTTMT